MRQGWKRLALAGTLALSCVTLVTIDTLPAWAADKSDKSPSVEKSEKRVTAKSSRVMRQFTGYVTAFDKDKLTVEKRGKKPQTRVFSKHADLKTTGDVEKDARVTVFYREEGGRSVAHRVVVKPENGSGKSRG